MKSNFFISTAFVVLANIFSFAHAIEYSFRATDFSNFDGSDLGPLENIDVHLDYSFDTGTVVIDRAEIHMGDYVLTEEDIVTSEIGSPTWIYIGGIPSGATGMTSTILDFWFRFDITTLVVDGFSYTYTGIDDFFDAQTYYPITPLVSGEIAMNLDEAEGFTVPSEGGRVDYDVYLTDFEPGIQFNQWSVLGMPNGDQYPIHKIRELRAADANGAVTYDRNYLNIPEWFEDGKYELRWFFVDLETYERYSASLYFTKGEADHEFTINETFFSETARESTGKTREAYIDESGNVQIITR